jgi:hypothetical protein
MVEKEIAKIGWMKRSRKQNEDEMKSRKVENGSRMSGEVAEDG